MQKIAPTISSDIAEEIAIKALTYLSNDQDLLGRFLALSGLDASQLREVISEPSFLAAILDFLMSDDSLVLSFATNYNLDPQEIVAAKTHLDPMSMANTGSI